MSGDTGRPVPLVFDWVEKIRAFQGGKISGDHVSRMLFESLCKLFLRFSVRQPDISFGALSSQI